MHLPTRGVGQYDALNGVWDEVRGEADPEHATAATVFVSLSEDDLTLLQSLGMRNQFGMNELSREDTTGLVGLVAVVAVVVVVVVAKTGSFLVCLGKAPFLMSAGRRLTA